MRRLVLLLVLLPLAIGAMAAFAWIQAGKDRYEALEQEGMALARVVRGAALEAADTLASAEQNLANRLAAVARRADYVIASTRAPAERLLQEIAEEERVGQIFFFDADDEPIAQARWPAPIRTGSNGLMRPGQKDAMQWRDAKAALARKRPEAGAVIVEGLRTNVFGTRERFGVFYGRGEGGTLLLRAGAREISALHDTFGLQPLLDRVQAVPGVTLVRLSPAIAGAAPQDEGAVSLEGPNLRVRLPVSASGESHVIDLSLSRARADRAVDESRRTILLGALLAIALALGAGTVLLVRERAVRRAEAAAAARLEEERRLAEMGALAGLVTHEISNPLNSIRVALGVLEDTSDDSRRIEVFEIMKEEVERMRHTLEGYMALAGADRRVRRAVPPKLLHGVRHRVAADAAHKGVDVHVEVAAEAPNALGDAIVLEQAITNLARNAIQATRDEGMVVLSWGPDERGVAITVRDEGPGFPEDRAELLRLGGTRREGGHGLGLPLAKRFIESHDGRMGLEDADGGGGLVRVTLPAASEAGTGNG